MVHRYKDENKFKITLFVFSDLIKKMIKNLASFDLLKIKTNDTVNV